MLGSIVATQMLPVTTVFPESSSSKAIMFFFRVLALYNEKHLKERLNHVPKTVWCKNVCHLQMVLIKKKLVRERERKGKDAEMFRIVKNIIFSTRIL